MRRKAKRVGDTAAAPVRAARPRRARRQHARAAPAARAKLGWAAQLHEIGTLVSHSDYHKHGAYILDNTDAPGFAVNELHALGQLVLGQRGKLRKLERRSTTRPS